MDAASLDLQTRRFIYDYIRANGQPPDLTSTAMTLQRPVQEVQASFQRLHDNHVIVLKPDGREILMANPFSAVPTPFKVETAGREWWGNCIWDALGIAALFKADARIQTECPDCGENLTVVIEGGQLVPGEGVIHFAVPARHWWNDIVFT